MRLHRKIALLASALTLPAAALVAAAAPANAAQGPQPVNCDGQQLTVRANSNNSSDHGGWNAVIVTDGGSGHLIPTSFSGSFYDVTTGEEIFSFAQAKGNGHGNHNQPTVSCSDVQTGLLGDFLEPGDELPPGTSPDDAVTFTIDVTAVWMS